MTTMKVRKKKILPKENVALEIIPGHIDDAVILRILYKNEINWKHAAAIKNFTSLNDQRISDWLNISVKTFREYKKPNSSFKENVKEQILLLLSVFKHGKGVFGSMDNFHDWLDQENFFFDKKRPSDFLNTVTGIRLVDERLTALEFGDNV